MGVYFSEILANYTMQYIDDVRWQEEMRTNPCLFMRAKSQLLLANLQRFNRPPEMETYLDDFTPPSYTDFQYISEMEQASPVVIQTSVTGYDQVSAGLTGADDNGTPYYRPINAEYNAETGEVTLNIDLPEGQSVEMDFYTDGMFNKDLTLRQKRIIGLCVAVGWYYQFANTFLNITPKISDKEFSLKSENAGITANTSRLTQLEHMLNGEIISYEHAVAYRNIIKPPNGMKLP